MGYEDVSRFTKIVLVYRYEGWYGKVHCQVPYLSVDEGRASEINRVIIATVCSRVEIRAYHRGFYDRIAKITLWVIMDRLMKSAYFLSISKTDTLEAFSWLYIQEIV